MKKPALAFFSFAVIAAACAKPHEPTTPVVPSPQQQLAADEPSSAPIASEPEPEPEPLVEPTSACNSRKLARCDRVDPTIDVEELSRKQRGLIGKRVRVRGQLTRVPGGCTEAACGNSCRDSILLGGRITLYVGSGDSVRDLACTRGAGDPCPGEPPQSTTPCCEIAIPAGDVIVTARVGRDGLEDVKLCAI